MAPLAVAALFLMSASPDLDEGRELYRALRYKAAEEPLSRARASKALTKAERREAHDLLARALAAQGKLDEAEVVYAELLAVDPEAPAPEGAAPKVMNAFRRARERVPLPQAEAGPVAEAPAPAPDPPVADEPSPAPPPQLVPVAPPDEAIVTAEPAPAPPRWAGWTVIGASIAVGVAAVGLGIAAVNDSASARGQYYASDALALDQSATGKAIAANVLCVAALLGTAAGALLWWWWR